MVCPMESEFTMLSIRDSYTIKFTSSLWLSVSKKVIRINLITKERINRRLNDNQNRINMNRVLTPELLKEVYSNVHKHIMASDAPTKERVEMSNSMWVEALKHCDVLGNVWTQRLYDLGFPDDGKKSMLTLQEILDVCDKTVMRCRCKSKDGLDLDMPVKLTFKLEDDGYSTYRFVGTFDGKDYYGVGYSAPCELEALWQLLKRDMELGYLTFEMR